jgi:hypothetical protein
MQLVLASLKNRRIQKIDNEIEGLAIFQRVDNYKNKPNYEFDRYAGINNGTTYTEPLNYDDKGENEITNIHLNCLLKAIRRKIIFW